MLVSCSPYSEDVCTWKCRSAHLPCNFNCEGVRVKDCQSLPVLRKVPSGSGIRHKML